jgi:phytochrome-interacting factor 4
MQDVEFESAVVTCEPAQKTTTAKRRRAAEVHNRSERVDFPRG